MAQATAAGATNMPVGNDSREKLAMENNEENAESMEAIHEKIISLLKESSSNGPAFGKAFDEAMSTVSKMIESLIRTGLEAFHRWENTSRELGLLREENIGKEIEFERLRAAEEKSRATVSVRISWKQHG